jgi:hypothetical protein
MEQELRDEIAPGEGCLRAIVRTGNATLDRLADAIEAATIEDIALLMIAINRRSTNGGSNADSNVQR